MKKLNLILGIVFLALALVGAILALVLPPEQIYFDIGFGNWPWGPPVVFFVLGIIFLATARIGQPEEPEAPISVIDSEKASLNKRFENMAWGFFLILWGGSMFIPDSTVSKGHWSISIGLIFLGLNAARYFNGIRMSGFTTFLGILSMIGGVAQLMGWKSMDGALFLIILGAYLILKPYFEKRQLFGKAEQN